jgi:hypothetical protein
LDGSEIVTWSEKIRESIRHVQDGAVHAIGLEHSAVAVEIQVRLEAAAAIEADQAAYVRLSLGKQHRRSASETKARFQNPVEIDVGILGPESEAISMSRTLWSRVIASR